MERFKQIQKELEQVKEENKKLKKDLSQFQRSILLIGGTDSDKSAVGNVLLMKDSNDNTEYFKESDKSVSQTKEVGEFMASGIKYRVVDIRGFGDRKSEEVTKAVKHFTTEGDYNLNQIFFVFKGRFSDGDKHTFRLLKEAIFNEDIVNYITFVRTGFPNFKNKKEREADIASLLNPRYNDEESVKMIEACGKRIIHVDNPSVNLNWEEDEDREWVEAQIKKNGLTRMASREELIKHLLANCWVNYAQDSEELIAQIII